MQVYVTVLGIIVAILVIAAILGKRNELKAEKYFRSKAKRNWGKPSDIDIRENRRKAIPKYFENHVEEAAIDDITWNDLGLDDVYDRVNYCQSGAGQEYLYYRLRTPMQSDDFDAFEKHLNEHGVKLIQTGPNSRHPALKWGFFNTNDKLGTMIEVTNFEEVANLEKAEQEKKEP